MKRQTLRLIATLLGWIFFAACSAPQRPEADFHALTLPVADGSELRLGAYQGQTVLVNFWATWCVPCRAELPALAAAQAAYGERGLAVITINLGEDPELVRAFTERIGVDLPLAIDTTGAAAEAFQVVNLPTSVLLSPEGVPLARSIGYLDEARLSTLLEAHLP